MSSSWPGSKANAEKERRPKKLAHAKGAAGIKLQTAKIRQTGAASESNRSGATPSIVNAPCESMPMPTDDGKKPLMSAERAGVHELGV